MAMSERAVIVTGFLLVVAAVAVTLVVARLRPDLLASPAATLAHAIRSRAAGLIAVALWAWLGWHFLAR
ncbi:DUF6186 family protein [Nocardia wallacei]|uniref:DUF6186 family protein n=1 Tax=Nocardia wallacei TaxID=480035 RepID=UPI0024569AC2|nr:DUF6186 family protein [Nocardia wallacei]